jgi:hypothetical protein
LNITAYISFHLALLIIKVLSWIIPRFRSNAMSEMPARAIANVNLTGCDPRTDLFSAEAPAVTLEDRLSNDPALPIAERPLDALADIAFDATLAARRRRAFRETGAAEDVYHWHTHRSLLASWRSDDLWQMVKSRNDELWVVVGEAASTLLAIEAALLHARSDAWSHISKRHDAFAVGEQPDDHTIADLRACRAEIVGLSAMLPAAKAASFAEYEAWLASKNSRIR